MLVSASVVLIFSSLLGAVSATGPKSVENLGGSKVGSPAEEIIKGPDIIQKISTHLEN